jgi:hypothetical protein
VNGYLQLWLACPLLSACCCWRGQLNTHLALQALFTQSSPVRKPLLQALLFPSTLGEVTLHPLSLACVFIYSSCGKCVFPPLLWRFPPTTTFISFSVPDCRVVLLLLLAAPCLFTAHVGGGSSPLSCGVFLPLPLSQAFPLLVAGHTPPLPLEPLWPGPAYLFTVPGRIPLPRSSELKAPHPLCNVFLLFLLLITQFLFFPQVEVSLSRGLYCSGPGLSVGVLRTAKLTLSVSFHAVSVQVTGSPGALLVSPFNMKWRFSVLAGGVEGSNFASSRWFCLQGVSPASLQDFTIGCMLSASSL